MSLSLPAPEAETREVEPHLGERPEAGVPNGPVVQSLRVGFRVLQLGTLLLFVAWTTGNMRELQPGTQAVVLRFGRIVRAQAAGLVLAWPQPVEKVVRQPSGERQMQLSIVPSVAPSTGGEVSNQAFLTSPLEGDAAPADAAAYLTGDGGVVLIEAAVTWRISDPEAYTLASAHVLPALRRVFLDAAATETAGRRLDDFLAVRPEDEGDLALEASRAALRGALADRMNRSLAVLARAGAGLGVSVTRVDVTALLPPVAKASFDSVLEAAQRADEGLAAARTDAARTQQQADRTRDRTLDDAHAAAAERVEAARSRTATILALEAKMDPQSRPALLDQLYRDRIAGVLRAAGRVSTVPLDGERVILSGAQP